MVKWLEFFCFLAWILAVVNGNQFNLAKVQILKIGASCNTKSGESGVCKSLSKCGVYLEGLQRQTIEYNSIAICEHTFYDEVVCCPNTPSNSQLPTGFISSETFKGKETFTEDTFEIPSEGQSVPEKVLKSGPICQTKTGEPGVCKLLSACGVYLEGLQKETIEYSSIVICSFMGQDEVICCPNNNLPTNHNAIGHIPTETPIRPIPPITRTIPSQHNTEFGRPKHIPILKEGESCQIKTGEPGVCKLLSACGVFMEGLQKQTIEYSSIHICSFMGQDEVICCPLKNNLPAGFQQQMDEVFSGTFKGAEVVTEGPTEDIIETPLMAGKILKVGASCNTKIGEPGVCKLLSACGVYLEGLQMQFIEYSSIAICSFKGQDEVVCCPDTPSNPKLPTGFIGSENFKGAEPFTEGPFGRHSEKQSVPGSICQTKTAEPGVCKLLSACGVYMEGLQKQTIEYSSIHICSFMGQDEVICCPNNNLPANHNTLGHIPTEPPRMPRPPFTGTIPSQNNTEVERPLPKILNVGSICQTKTGELGVCKLLIACGVYLEGLQKETIEYNSIAICSFIVRDEVVCCPNINLPTNHNTLGHISTETPIRPTPTFGTISSQNNTEFERPKKNLKAESICQTKTGEPGICKLLSACGVYLEGLQKETIEYSSINICSFMDKDEVVCCPYYETLSNPQSTTEFIASVPFNALQTVTEGPFEQPAVPEKVLTAGSICKTKTDKPGVCKLLSACGVYIKGLQKQTIEYSSINICSFMGQDEVVCCPNNHHRQGHIPTEPPRMPRPGRPGSICKTKTDKPGVCKLLSACGIYMKGLQNQTIEYGSINICSFMGQDEVVCCPNNDNPRNHPIPSGRIPTQTPNIRIRGGPPPPSQNSSEVIRPAVTGFSKDIKRLEIFNIWLKVKERRNAAKHQDVWRIFKNTYQIKSDQVRNRIVKLCRTIHKKWDKSSRNESIFLSKNNHWLNTVEVFTSVPVPNNQVRSKKTVKQLLDSYDARELITKAGLSKEQYQTIRNIVNEKTEIEIFPDYDMVQRESQNYTYPQKY